MPIFNLHPDDRPPQQLEIDDRLLRRQLDHSLTQRFRQQCDPDLLYLLSDCDWSITTTANVALLVIVCPDRAISWQVLNQVVPLGSEMAKFSQDAKLRIYPTPEMLDFFEIRVDELSIYRENRNG
ncbi:MAG: hypothetical protein MUF49_17060 [Oculatellaceae cyanobacterium Prado106]|jgi:hypothetical protein|nr:hypothetical protein [Oculatellaceae cyanobacterium Prado106]